ncbi:YicC family protein [Venenivibrio stagnispumantis]|uniref:TIGR00255 family protein n=1 Tax=Venenivibrio stagnispumantis TaxID=407998 RepID=A0AA46AEH2_9AQUI|nr:YicC/YloC family endoribonuclease [Venenivibrio stagnispumantis]MCW4572892.1 YicC family protein [Venenivibrio stagnispumantis]SMP12828.1 TIGR00255 family protein [Venenivibrio stagnispumantis]
MPYSMTGFSFIKKNIDNCEISVKIKSVNNKGIDISIKGNKDILFYLELDIRKKVQEFFERGSFQIYINYVDNNIINLAFDVESFKNTLNSLRDIFQNMNLNLSDDKLYDISFALTNKEEKEIEEDKKSLIMEVLEEALTKLKEERKKEAQFLIEDIDLRLSNISDLLEEVEKIKDDIIKRYQEKISLRIKQLLGENFSERAFIESSIIAEKMDITEEIVRLKAHISAFKDMLKKDEAIGRKLDFLTQEMLREATTMGNKIPDLSSFTVQIKSEIDKIKQQVQNIE